MSTGKSTVFPDRPRVIARAYRGEPVQVRALRRRGDLIEVYGSKEDVTLPLPREALYHYDESLYGALCDAFVSGDKKRLADLWAKASRFGKDESDSESREPAHD